MRALPSFLLGLVAAAGISLPAAAHEVIYESDLTGAQESPPTGSLGTGFVRVTIDLDVVTMHIESTFTGLTGTTLAAHIHCCVVAPNPNAIVATTVPSFPGFPTGVTSGSFDQTFDLSSASSYNPQFVTASGTLGDALDALLNGLSAGTAYFNIHTSTSQAGEIRGNLHLVPEPTGLLLVGLGVAGLGLIRRGARR